MPEHTQARTPVWIAGRNHKCRHGSTNSKSVHLQLKIVERLHFLCHAFDVRPDAENFQLLLSFL